MAKPAERNGKRRAAILVLTLWIVVVLTLLSASLLEEVYLELKITKLHRDDFEAMALARAGIARAVADLRNDMLMDYEGKAEAIDALGDVWALKQDKRNKINIELGPRGGTYTVWVEDESARINLNAVDLNMLKTVFYEVGLKEQEAQAVAAAILDWRDPDDRATLPGVGLEDEYYSAGVAETRGAKLEEDQPLPYRCKNDAFSSVDELLSVYGVTPELYYGVDPEEEDPPNPIEQLKLRVKALRQRGRREKAPGLRDVFTVVPTAGINLNTADRFVLQVLMRNAVGNPASAKSLVDKIINARGIDGRGRAKNENAFRNIGDLVQFAGIPRIRATQLQRTARLAVKSNTYRITALGEVGPAQHLISTVVARAYERFQPDQVTRMMGRGMIGQQFVDRFERRWGNRQEDVNEAAVRVIQWFEL